MSDLIERLRAGIPADRWGGLDTTTTLRTMREAADDLTASNERLTAAVEDYNNALAEIERLKAALKPFADLLDVSEANARKRGVNPATVLDTQAVLSFGDVPGLNVGHFRAARTALGETK